MSDADAVAAMTGQKLHLLRGQERSGRINDNSDLCSAM